MHEGIPPGGALIPELLVAANESLGNRAGAAALEIPASIVLRAGASMDISIDGQPRLLSAGEELIIEPGDSAARYVAVAGGIDVPTVLGGKGTLLVAGMGGHEGRMLRAGDVIRPASARAHATRRIDATADAARPIRVVTGPDEFPEAALQALLNSEFRVRPADRVGMRLVGPALPVGEPDDVPSEPMVRGAVQVTRGGGIVVLGPDHPTTGGYRVIAVVVSDDHGALSRRRAGSPVRFEAVLARGVS
jgi:allophanate hydrolase subunit 2